MPFKTISKGASGGASQEWEYKDLTTADQTRDPNNIVSIAPSFNSGTGVNTLTIDKDKVSAVKNPADAAVYAFDTGLTAADLFNTTFLLEIHNNATLSTSDIVIYAGLTSDMTDMDNFCMASGVDYDLLNMRGLRVRNTTFSTGSQGSTARGVIGTINKGNGSSANSWNMGVNAATQYVDANYEGLNVSPSATPSGVDATAGTDSIYFFVAIGFSLQAAATVEVQFALKVAPFIKSV